MKVKKLLIPLSFLLLLPATQAQTLKEVVRGTLITNPEIQALRANTKAYRYYVDEEEGKLYPSINLETFFEELNTERDNQADERQSGTNTQLKLEQTLFDGWLTPSKIEEAKKDLKATQYRNSATIEAVVLDAVDAYLNVVKNEEFRLLSENNLLVHEDYLEVAADAEEVSGDTLDRMQVESKIFSANAKFSEVKRDALQAKATLEKLYGQKVNNNFCRPVITNQNDFNDLQEVISEALTVNYSVLEEINRIKTQRAIVTQEKSRFYPTITARLLREVDDGVDVKDVKKTEDSFRITLSYNIFNGGQDSAILEREKIFLKESQKTLDNVVNQVIEEVKINYTKFHTAKKRIAYLENYLAKNKDILFVYLEQFEGGTRGFIDILNHEAELFRAKTDLIQEQFTYTLAYYELQNLLSKLSSTVLSSDKQVCQEIKVDVERRKLSSAEDETTADEELAAIFEEGAEGALDDGPADDKDAKVQSLLNKILNEIYDPNAVNRNINVSQVSHSVARQEVLPEGDPKDEALKELIKIQQELEEQALRNEQNDLKSQIKDAAKTLAKKTTEEDATIGEKKKAVEEVSKATEQATQKTNQALKTADTSENKIQDNKANEVKAVKKEVLPTAKKKKSKVLHEFNDSKLLSLEQRQAISRALGEKFKAMFRQANGLDAKGYPKVEKVVEKSKDETIKELSQSLEQKVPEIKSKNVKEKSPDKIKEELKEKDIDNVKANAQKIRNAALEKAKAFKEEKQKVSSKQSEDIIAEPSTPQFKKDENVKMVEDKIAENMQALESSKEELSQELSAVKRTQEMISKYTQEEKVVESIEVKKEPVKKETAQNKEKVEKTSTKNIQTKVEEKKTQVSQKEEPIKTVEENKDMTANKIDAQKVSESTKEIEQEVKVIKPQLTLEQRQAQSRKLAQEYMQAFRKKEGLDELGYSNALKEKILKETLEEAQKQKEKILKEAQLSEQKQEELLKKEEQERLEREKAQKIRENAIRKAEILKEAAIRQEAKKEQMRKSLNIIVEDEPKAEAVIEEKPVVEEIKAVSKTKTMKENQTAVEKHQVEKTVAKVQQPSIEKKEKSEEKNSVEIPNNTTQKIKKTEENNPLIKNSLKQEFLGSKSKKYTLGILTLSVKQKPDFIKKYYNLEKNIIVYKSQNNGKEYFKVIYGVYDSAKEAKADIQNLHKTLQKNGVFVNRISTHQKLFKKYNPNGEL